MITLREVKRDLPSVTVKIGRKVLPARVTGRLNRFATVTIGDSWSHALGAAWEDRHFSWEAVTRAVNTGKPLSWN